MDAVSKMRVCLVCVWEVLTSGRLTFIKGHQRKLKGLTLAMDLTSILQDTSDVSFVVLVLCLNLPGLPESKE